MLVRSCNINLLGRIHFGDISVPILAVFLLSMWVLTACSTEETPINLGEPSKLVVASQSEPEMYAPAQKSVNLGVVSGSPNSYSEGISVTGASSIATEPDLVLLNLGVEAFAVSVKKARSRAAKSMDSLMGLSLIHI